MEAAIGPRPMADARVGQQGTLTRVWARRGTRPRAVRDTRYEWAARHCPRTNGGPWLAFGAVCPERATTAGLVLPFADAKAMNLHLAEIARNVALVLDGAGRHRAGQLKPPDNLTLLLLPAYAPELNPVENVWEYLRKNKLANTVFDA
jgi:hypothetical protein